MELEKNKSTTKLEVLGIETPEQAKQFLKEFMHSPDFKKVILRLRTFDSPSKVLLDLVEFANIIDDLTEQDRLELLERKTEYEEEIKITFICNDLLGFVKLKYYPVELTKIAIIIEMSPILKDVYNRYCESFKFYKSMKREDQRRERIESVRKSIKLALIAASIAYVGKLAMVSYDKMKLIKEVNHSNMYLRGQMDKIEKRKSKLEEYPIESQEECSKQAAECKSNVYSSVEKNSHILDKVSKFDPSCFIPTENACLAPLKLTKEYYDTLEYCLELELTCLDKNEQKNQN